MFNIIMINVFLVSFTALSLFPTRVHGEIFHHGFEVVPRGGGIKIWTVRDDANPLLWDCGDRSINDAVYRHISKDFIQCDADGEWRVKSDGLLSLGLEMRANDEARKAKVAEAIVFVDEWIRDIKPKYVRAFLTASPKADTEMFNAMPVEHHYKIGVR